MGVFFPANDRARRWSSSAWTGLSVAATREARHPSRPTSLPVAISSPLAGSLRGSNELSAKKNGLVSFLQEFSIPLIGGVFAALLAANLAPHAYHAIVDWKPFGTWTLLGHELTLHFLVNDLFMAFFFGIAAKEITEAALPGGSLNPIKNAINPLIATAGGVLGPVAVFFLLLMVFYHGGSFAEEYDWDHLLRGWGIPTATDIALAWLVARAVFGRGHPAINFLLLLAIADDAIGLVIIAVFYGDPHHPARPEWLGLVALGMAAAFALRRARVRHWPIYIFGAGPLSWIGFAQAHLHPALALVPIVPFLPGPKRDTGLFVEEDEVDLAEKAGLPHGEHSALHQFEHRLKLFVDLGLFFFAFANAGVRFAGIGPMTWIVFGSLVIGKTLGISLFARFARRVGFPLPNGMSMRDLWMAGFVGALGLTVALFVAGAAFVEPGILGQAKMGALFSGAIGLMAVLLGRLFGFGNAREPQS